MRRRRLRQLLLATAVLCAFPVAVRPQASDTTQAYETFDGAWPSPDWMAGPEYILASGELQNTAQDENWRHLALYTALTDVQDVTVVWGGSVFRSNLGSGAAAIVIGADAASVTANGYAVLKREEGLQLWLVQNGDLDVLLDQVPSPAQSTLPGGGDSTRVVFREEVDGYFFDVYVNDQFGGTLADSARTLELASPHYAGVILYGIINGINNVESVRFVRYVDNTPPSPITGLSASAGSPFSAELSWTAPTESGGTSRRARSYDVRYSTAPIDEQNFEAAKPAIGAADLVPQEGGANESFVVYGLEPGTVYYFAVRSTDVAGNVSAVSNVASVTTPAKPDRQIYFDGFSESTLGPHWVAPQDFVPEAGELQNTGGTRALAVWVGEPDPARVSVKWGAAVDSAGAAAGGLALMLDAPSTTANGYLLSHEGDSLKLYPVSAGVPGSSPLATAASASGQTPAAGDLVEVEILEDAHSTHFLVYVNGEIDAVVHEPEGQRPQATQYYAGLILSPGGAGAADEFVAEVPTNAPATVEIAAGDGQSGQVSTLLPTPLTVRVRDTDGNPVSGVMVDFLLLSGAGTLSVDSLAQDGHYYLEAEDGKLRGAVQEVADANASDSAAVVNQHLTHSYVEFPLYVGTAGDYEVWLRYIAGDASSNSLYGLQLDGGDTLRNAGADWDLPITAEYAWYRLEGLSLSLTRGVHHLRVLFHDIGFRLDKALLNRDAGYVPQGTGEPAPSPTNLTDADGLAWSRLTLGQQAGIVRVLAAVPDVDSVTFQATAVPGPPDTLLVVSGDAQQGPAGQVLPESLVVQVQDAFGNPVSGVEVQFQVVGGNGSVSPTSVLTDEAGLAKTAWTLGSDTTSQAVEASSPDLPGQSVRFTATVSEGVPTSLVKIAGDGQEGTVGQALGDSLKVRVLDNAGQPVSGHRVSFSIRSGGGQLNGVGNSVDVFTNGVGYAAVQLELPTTSGTVEVWAEAYRDGQALEGSPAVFHVTASPDVPYRMVYVSGNDQTGPVGARLAEPFVVRIEDQYGNACPDHTVRFEVQAGGGSLEGQSVCDVQTDADGRASVYYTLGTEPGVENRVVATSSYGGADLEGSPVVFRATPHTGEASVLTYVSGDSQEALVGTHLPDPLVVRVTDAFGNPIEGFPVDFEVRSGGGQLDSNRAWTDAQGLARTGLTLGTQAGQRNQVVWATASRNGTPLDGSPVEFRATALPDVPYRLTMAGGNNQTGPVGGTLPQPLAAKVMDRYGNPIAGHPVRFEVVEGGGSVDGAQSVERATEADGIARVYLTLGPTPGDSTNKVRARAWRDGVELAGSPLLFVASATAGEARKLVEVSGNHQTGKAGQDLPEPFVVRVTDVAGNGIAGYLVHIRVVSGGGNIGGDTELDLATNSEGYLRVTLTLGPDAGVDNNVVEISAPNLEGSPIRFVASAVASDPFQLVKVSGDSQTAAAGTPLPEPLVVRVTDEFGNPVAGHTVRFSVVSGGGSFGGAQSLEVATDDSGRASAVYTLGPQPGERNNVVEVEASYSGQPLEGSPVRFVASAVLGPPSRLTYVSGDSQAGIVNSPLLYPFRVRVTDAAGNPLEGHPVTFVVTAGGGKLDNGDTSLVRTSNRNGLCEVRLTLGPQPGVLNNVVEARSSRDGQPLDGSPVVFRATARSSAARRLSYVSGNGQTGVVGEPLASPFRVRVTDSYGNPVQGHLVTFRVTEGGGKLDGSDTLVVKQTDALGYAECVLTLGTRAGTNNNSVEASSSNGIGPLQGSPILFTASAVPGTPDPDSCAVWVNPDTVLADGQSRVEIVARLVDRYGNPTPGKAVVFTASGGGHTIEQPSAATDQQGIARGSIVSTEAGAKTVRARDITDQLDLNCTATVVFLPLAAERIALFSGNNQARNLGTALAESLAVKVVDRNGNGVAGYPVTFVVTRGTGRVLEPQPVQSDSRGIAAVHYVLSTRPGSDLVEARAAGLEGSPVLFRLTALEATPAHLQMLSGDGQVDTVNQWLPDLLRLRVTDVNGDPVWGVPIRFSVPMGGEAYPALDSTDAWGVSEVHFRLGRKAGDYLAVAETNGISERVVFRLHAVPAAPARLTLVSGDGQVGTVGLTLPSPLVVRAEDRFGNGVEGVEVNFEVVAGGGTIPAAMPRVTDAQGRASVSWTLGTRSGEQIVQAWADELEGSPVVFRATAQASAPDSIGVFSGDGQRGQAGKQLSLPIEAIVLDRFGNGVPGVAVTFTTVDGMSRIVETGPVSTDERGVASAHWILGPQPGENVAWAIRLGVRGSPAVFHAVGEANQYPVIHAPTDTTVREETAIEFYVTAEDPDGGAVSLGASELPERAQFDSLDSGRFYWKPGLTDAGVYTIRFHARDDEGGVTYHRTVLRVLNKNRPPEITGFAPQSTTLAATYPDSIRFSVSATDADQDSLRYEWWVRRAGNTLLVARRPEYLFVSTRHDPGAIVVEALVLDGEDTARVSWQITVITAVELESFAAADVPFEGVVLTWKTARQRATLGFNVLRAEAEDGDYEQVNDHLLPLREDRSYRFVDRSAEPGRVYFYRLEDVNVSGRKTLHDPIRVRVALPERFRLHQNYPNPFNPITRIRFEVPRPERVRIEIYNVLGKRVRTLVDRPFDAGYHEVVWDGTDDYGRQVSSGIYYYRAVCGGKSHIRKMALLR